MRLLIGKMGIDRRWFLGFLGLLISVLMTGVPGHAQASARMRWDIVSVDTSTTPPTVNAGGSAVALAGDSMTSLTLTGTGFFRKLPPTTRFSAIAKEGGGTWETKDSTGTSTGKGAYTVKKGPAFFVKVPGTFSGVTDTIGDITKAGAGLLIVEVKYDDGDRGVLGVACSLPDSPATAFEGVIATKGSTEYLTIGSPNLTLFHVIPPGT